MPKYELQSNSPSEQLNNSIEVRLTQAIKQTEAEIRRLSPRLIDRMEEIDHSVDFIEETTGTPSLSLEEQLK